jgi:putative nucleotidyltransferase with HDIG domain
MGGTRGTRLSRYLPQVLFTTFVVLVLPVIVIWELRSFGVITSTLMLMIFGVALSLLIGWIGRKSWESRPGSGDLLFGDLLVWGFVRRWLTERRLASASRMLGLRGAPRSGESVRSQARQPGGLNREQRARNLEQLAAALEARDPYTSGHSRRVARYAAMIAKTMGLSPSEVSDVRAAAAVHDVGKIDTPLELLNKPSRLSDEEFAEIKKHALRGAQLIHQHLDPKLAEIVVHHHERLDGSGYPTGLSGEQIPIGARIIAVADTFDALTSNRAYRSANPHRKALSILRQEAGTQLDPAAVRAFNSNYSGARPLAMWALITALPQRLLSGLFGQLNAAGGAASTAKALAATAAAVGTGSAIAGTVPPVEHVPASPKAAVALERSAAGQAPGQLGMPVGAPPGAVRPGGSSGAGHGGGPHDGGNTGSTGSGGGSDTGSSNGSSGSAGGGGNSGDGTESGSGNSGSGNTGSGSGNSGSGSSGSGGGGSSGSGGGGSSGSGGGGSSGSGGSGSGGSGNSGSSGSGGGGNSGSGGGGSSGSGGSGSSGSGGGGSSGSGGGSSGSGGGN